MRQYSIDKVELSWLNVDLKEGFAAGSTITEARTSPRWTIKPTGVGKIVRVFNPDESGTLTVVMDQESNTHQVMLGLAEADRLNRNIVGPGLLRDTSTGQAITYQNMFITTPPDEVRATESSTFAWVFAFETRLAPPTLADANVVGD